MSLGTSITCRELIEFLDDYVADALPADQRERFEAHLEICPACVDYLASYCDTMRLEAEAFDGDAPLVDAVPEELVRAVLASRRR